MPSKSQKRVPVAEQNQNRSKGKLGVAPNVKAAAARMDLLVEMLKAASESGCDAFQANGRVHMDKLKAWISANPAFVAKWSDKGGIPPKGISQAIKEHFAALESKRRYEERIGKVIQREKIAGIVASVGEKQRAILKAYVSTDVLAKICEQMHPLFDACAEGKDL